MTRRPSAPPVPICRFEPMPVETGLEVVACFGALPRGASVVTIRIYLPAGVPDERADEFCAYLVGSLNAARKAFR